MTVPCVRNRQNLASASLKRVAPEEIEMAIKLAVSNAYGLRADELYSAVGNILGFSRVTASQKLLLQGFVEQLVKEGELVNQGECLIVKDEETNKLHQVQDSKEIADHRQVATQYQQKVSEPNLTTSASSQVDLFIDMHRQVATQYQQKVSESNLTTSASSQVDLFTDMLQQMCVGEVRPLKNRAEKKAVSQVLSLQGFTGVYQAERKCTVWSNAQKRFVLNHLVKTLKRER